MSRPLRIVYEGAGYHVMNRGPGVAPFSRLMPTASFS